MRITGWTLHNADLHIRYTLGDQHGFILEENYFPGDWEQTHLVNKKARMVFDQEARPDTYLWMGETCCAPKAYYPDASTSNITYKNTVYEGSSFIASTWFDMPASVVIDGGWRDNDTRGCCNGCAECNNVNTYDKENRPPEVQAIIDRAGPENKSLYDGLDWIPGKPNPVNLAHRTVAGPAQDKSVTAFVTRGSNPSLSVAVPQRRHLTVSVYDMTGRACATLCSGIAQQGTHRYALGESRLGRGSYIVAVRSRGILKTLPLVLVQ